MPLRAGVKRANKVLSPWFQKSCIDKELLANDFGTKSVTKLTKNTKIHSLQTLPQHENAATFFSHTKAFFIQHSSEYENVQRFHTLMSVG